MDIHMDILKIASDFIASLESCAQRVSGVLICILREKHDSVWNSFVRPFPLEWVAPLVFDRSESISCLATWNRSFKVVTVRIRSRGSRSNEKSGHYFFSIHPSHCYVSAQAMTVETCCNMSQPVSACYDKDVNICQAMSSYVKILSCCQPFAVPDPCKDLAAELYRLTCCWLMHRYEEATFAKLPPLFEGIQSEAVRIAIL